MAETGREARDYRSNWTENREDGNTLTHTHSQSRCMLTHKIDLSECGFVVTGWQIYKTHVYTVMLAVDTRTLLSGDGCCTIYHPAAWW